MSVTDKYSAEALALRIHARALDVGMQAAVDEMRDLLARAEWMAGWTERLPCDAAPRGEQHQDYSRSAKVTP